jgi:hypothetical protein
MFAGTPAAGWKIRVGIRGERRADQREAEERDQKNGKYPPQGLIVTPGLRETQAGIRSYK